MACKDCRFYQKSPSMADFGRTFTIKCLQQNLIGDSCAEGASDEARAIEKLKQKCWYDYKNIESTDKTKESLEDELQKKQKGEIMEEKKTSEMDIEMLKKAFKAGWEESKTYDWSTSDSIDQEKELIERDFEDFIERLNVKVARTVRYSNDTLRKLSIDEIVKIFNESIIENWFQDEYTHFEFISEIIGGSSLVVYQLNNPINQIYRHTTKRGFELYFSGSRNTSYLFEKEE